jgi:hypothetical protein
VHSIVKGNATKAIWLENFMKLVFIQIHPTIIGFDYQYVIVLIENPKWIVASYGGSLLHLYGLSTKCTLFKCHKRIVKSSI